MKFGILSLTNLGAGPKVLLAVCLALVLIMPAPAAHAQTFLTNAELLEIMPGSTIYSKNDRGRPWAQIYSEPDGKIKGTIRSVFGKTRKYAKWFVRDGQWCENWGAGETCWHVERVGFQSLKLYSLDGKPRRNMWTLEREDITG